MTQFLLKYKCKVEKVKNYLETHLPFIKNNLGYEVLFLNPRYLVLLSLQFSTFHYCNIKFNPLPLMLHCYYYFQLRGIALSKCFCDIK